MAASGFQKFFRNRLKASSKTINCFHKAHTPFPTPLVLTQIPQITKPFDQFSIFDRLRTEDVQGSRFGDSNLYASFSFEFFLNPGSTFIPIRSELDNVTAVDDDSRTIKADSVKKKRKKKMNKHKLRKLRKRLRRKT